jgi:hypothetical protein
MQAPLGLAVIGGLVMSTFATLLVLPSVFALVIGKRMSKSPSIYPDDPESKHFDPRVFIDEPPAHAHAHGETPAHAGHGPGGHVATAPHAAHPGATVLVPGHIEDDALVFLRQILDEARSKRHDMVTHYTVDDLRNALGFAKGAHDPDEDDPETIGAG